MRDLVHDGMCFCSGIVPGAGMLPFAEDAWAAATPTTADMRILLDHLDIDYQDVPAGPPGHALLKQRCVCKLSELPAFSHSTLHAANFMSLPPSVPDVVQKPTQQASSAGSHSEGLAMANACAASTGHSPSA